MKAYGGNEVKAELKLNGIDELETAIKTAEEKMGELKKAVSAVHVALANVGVEVNQPPDRSDG